MTVARSLNHLWFSVSVYAAGLCPCVGRSAVWGRGPKWHRCGGREATEERVEAIQRVRRADLEGHGRGGEGHSGRTLGGGLLETGWLQRGSCGGWWPGFYGRRMCLRACGVRACALLVTPAGTRLLQCLGGIQEALLSRSTVVGSVYSYGAQEKSRGRYMWRLEEVV